MCIRKKYEKSDLLIKVVQQVYQNKIKKIYFPAKSFISSNLFCIDYANLNNAGHTKEFLKHFIYGNMHNFLTFKECGAPTSILSVQVRIQVTIFS